MENYYQKEIETASHEQIRAWQSERLVKTINHVYKNNAYYRKLMEEDLLDGIMIGHERIVNIDDIVEICSEFVENDRIFYNQMKINNEGLKMLRKERRDNLE